MDRDFLNSTLGCFLIVKNQDVAMTIFSIFSAQFDEEKTRGLTVDSWVGPEIDYNLFQGGCLKVCRLF